MGGGVFRTLDESLLYRLDSAGMMVMKKGSFLRLARYLFIAAGLVLLPVERCLCALELTGAEREFISQKQTINFVSQKRYAPFEFVDENGQHEGMMLDVVRWLAVEIGFQPVFHATTFEEAQQDVLSGKADVLTSLFFSPKRSEMFEFTGTLFDVPASIFVQAERTDIKDLADLSGKTIAMQAGDYAQEFLESKGIPCRILSTRDFGEATDLVAAGLADAVIGDEQIVLYHIYSHRLTKRVKKVGMPLFTGKNCMAASRENGVLMAILDKGVKEARAAGVLDKINNKWLGTRYDHHESWLSRFLWIPAVAAGSMVFISAWVWLWNVRLRRVVQERTQDLAKSVESLKQSEARYRALFEQSRDAIFITTRNGDSVAANQAFLDLTGSSREEFDSLSLPRFWSSTADRKLWQKELEQKGFTTDFPCGVQLPNGAFRTWLLSSTVVHGEDGITLYQNICRDVTESRKLEEQLRQAAKMEAIGHLAGGVAHDFNNILTVITGYTTMLVEDTELSDHRREWALQIGRAAEQAAGLTRQLLAFGRKQLLEVKVLDLNAVVANLETMLRRLIGEHIELYTVFDRDPGKVRADPGRIEQVLINLVVNARDAMPKGGILTIKTENVVLDEGYTLPIPELKSGEYAMISVSDTGCGMDAETISRIFDPFFTTKGVGVGTGLGLSTVFGIVKQHQGHVSVDSFPGKGSTFRLYWPRVFESEPERTAHIAPPLEITGTETVLVVEDEEVLRSLTAEILGSLGYTVLTAGLPQEALEVSRSYQGKIDIMLTDVVLPQMDGKTLFSKLSPERPDMKVLFMSGYAGDAIQHHGVLDDGLNFLPKPFDVESLARKLREVLERPPVNASTG